MRKINALFEYQKFNPNSTLQTRIDAVAEQYLAGGVELADDDLNVAAAGDLYQMGSPLTERNADEG